MLNPQLVTGQNRRGRQMSAKDGRHHNMSHNRNSRRNIMASHMSYSTAAGSQATLMSQKPMKFGG